MRKVKVLMGMALFICSWTVFAANDLALGAMIPKGDTELLDISGKNLTLAGEMKENGLLVIFSCNTCPYVIACEDRYKDLSKLCSDRKIGLVLVNSNEGQRGGVDSIDEMKAHAKKYSYDFRYAVDAGSVLATSFGATRTPHVFLFSKDSKLAYKGAIDDSVMDAANVEKTYLADAIKALAAGKPIPVTETKSIGCSIKWKK